MDPVGTIRGRVCPLDRSDIDTDQILPKQFLKRIERDGFGPFAFHDWRYDADGRPRADFPMNRPEHQGARVLLTGANFGCGSSREHAPWALQDAGFRAVVASSFADIFRVNCGKIGLVAVQLGPEEVRSLFAMVQREPRSEVTVDVASQLVAAVGFDAHFDIDSHTKRCLLDGLDEIGLTLEHEADIAQHEDMRPSYRPLVT